MKQHRLLMATDIPFWRRSTGAEQRIASLVQSLDSEAIQVRTFFLAPCASLSEQDNNLISQQRLDIAPRSSDQPPKKMFDKIGWYADATLHQIQHWSHSKRTPTEPDDPDCRNPTIHDYRWPWAIKAFAEAIDEFKPTVILIQYIKLAYLLESLTQRRAESLQCIIDTHDVLHQRTIQFQQYGFEHWITIDRESESRELQRFDTILAIQEDEATLFREMAPQCETIVCGYSPGPRSSLSSTPTDCSPSPDVGESSGQRLVLGYLGSANDSNGHAIEKFLEQVWNPIQASTDLAQLTLVIAGGVCDWLKSNGHDSALAKNIEMLGRVETLDEFYHSVDVIINPVEFGTGLKIKNCEAISFGKPLITTEHGLRGMPGGLESAVLVCQSPEEMSRLLLALASDIERLDRIQRAAAQLSQTKFSDEQAYSQLKQSIYRGK